MPRASASARNAHLAYFAITGAMRGLHFNTRQYMRQFLVFGPYTHRSGLTLHRDSLTPEGWALARQSALWASHMLLTGWGYLLSDAPQRPGHLRYVRVDGATAYIGRDRQACCRENTSQFKDQDQ